jgi:hypothetical protein
MSVIWSGCRCVYKKWPSFHSQQFHEVLLCWHYIYKEQVPSHGYPAFVNMAIWAHSHAYTLSCSKSSPSKQWWVRALEHECSWATSMQTHFTSAILLLHFIIYSLTNLYNTYMNQTSSFNPLVLNVTDWQHAMWRSEHRMLPIANGQLWLLLCSNHYNCTIIILPLCYISTCSRHYTIKA